MSDVKLGVNCFSLTNEWLAGQYTLESLVDQIGRRGLGTGVEIIGFQSLRGFPRRVEDADIRSFRAALDRNGLEPTSLASNADVALRADRWLDDEASVDYMRAQIDIAARMGFPIVRIQSGLTPAVIERIEPIAAGHGVRLGMEIHAPEGPNTPKILATREVYDRLQSEYLGFVPDFSSCMRAIPTGMLGKLGRDGLSDAGIAALDQAWRSPGPPFARYGKFAQEAAELGEPDGPVAAARLVFTMFGRESTDDWAEILPQVVHIHGKFYDIAEDGTSPSIDYAALMRIFGESEYDGYISTEWEGHAYAGVAEVDAFDLIARHHEMCRTLLGRTATAGAP